MELPQIKLFNWENEHNEYALSPPGSRACLSDGIFIYLEVPSP